MSDDGFRIRFGNEADLGAVLALERACEGAPHWSEPVWRALLQAAPGLTSLRQLFVAGEADHVAGFLVVMLGGDVAEIESVGVAAEMRRRGVGAALCRYAMHWAAGRGASQMELEVRSEAAGARRLYASLGFVEQGIRRGYYRRPDDDAVLLSVVIAGSSEATGNARAKV